MLLDPILITRTVNYLYMIMVIALGITVFIYCLYRKYYKKDGELLVLYVYAILVWALIESVCIFAGFRTYSESQVIVFLTIVLAEDPAWVVIGFVAARWLYKRIN